MTPVPQIEAAMQAYAAESESDHALDRYQAALRFYNNILEIEPFLVQTLIGQWARDFKPRDRRVAVAKPERLPCPQCCGELVDDAGYPCGRCMGCGALYADGTPAFRYGAPAA